MKKDSSVELIRIFGSLFVVGVHICLGPLNGEVYDLSRIFISCLVADGVAIFWIIAGFFLFNNSYTKVLKKTKNNIVIPLVVYSAFCFYLSAWVLYDLPLLQSLWHGMEEYINLFRTLLTWRSPVPCGSHLWYLYTYILLMIIFPVLKSFVDYLSEDSAREKIFVIISFCFLVINDITSNQLAGFSLDPIISLIPASIELIYGHLLYKYKDKFYKIKYIALGLGGFFGLNLFRSVIQYRRYIGGATDNSILFWFSSIGVMCSVCILIFGFSINYFIKSGLIKSWICNIGSCTFYIYLIHNYVIALLGKYGITERVSLILTRLGNEHLYEIGYTVVMTILVFCISLIGAYIIKYIQKIVLKIKKLLLSST